MKTKTGIKKLSGRFLRGLEPNKKVVRLSAQVAAFAAALFFLPSAGWAGGVVVNCTETDLRTAMAGGGTVTFTCDGTIALSSTITNTVDALLDASGHQVTINGGGNRVFCVTTNATLELIHLTIANGSGRRGGGILNLGGHVALQDVVIRQNTADYGLEPQAVGAAEGGGLYNQGGRVAATNCVFSENQARQLTVSNPASSPSRIRGGALVNEHGNIYLQSCSFVSNSVFSPPGPFNIHGTAHEADGGAIANIGTLEANLCTFLNNLASADVGGGYGGQGGDADGGAFCNFGILRLSQCLFLSNTATGGPGGQGGSGWPSTQPGPGGSGGTGGSGNGGALFNAGTATVADCSFTGNFGRGGEGGTGGQGGSYFGPPNKATRGGNGGNGGTGGAAVGAICDINALCLLTNCAVISNAAIAGTGGAGGPGGYGNPNGNSGGAGAAGQAFGSLRSVGAIVMSTVLAGNSPGGDCFGTFTDGGGNVSSDGSCAFTNPIPFNGGATALPPFYLVHNFTAQEDSYVDAHPLGTLVTAPDGRLFGVTSGDAWPGAGAAYQVSSNGTDSSFSVVQAFGLDPTFGPAGTLVLAGEMLFGTTVRGGQSYLGSVYQVRADGSDYQILHSFAGGMDGQLPGAGLVLSGTTLYGTTTFGGISNYGTLFRIETNGSGYGILHHFLGGTNGASPAAELTLSGATLYGTTWSGGYTSGGTVFKINTDGNAFAVLRHFDSAVSPAHPWAGLALVGATLFGTTPAEGYSAIPNSGSVYRINTDGSSFSVLKQFADNDGPGSHAGLIFSDGKLFGTTAGFRSPASIYGTNYGSVFMMNADGSGYTVLKQFTMLDGPWPNSNFLPGPNGNLLKLGNRLYGTTANGGFYGAGVAFSLALEPPQILYLPNSQTVEQGGAASFTVEAVSLPALSARWFFNGTNPLAGATSLTLTLDAAQFAQAGAYSVVLSNAFGATTSTPMWLNVIAPVARSLVQGLKLMGDTGSLLHVEYANALGPKPAWTPLTIVGLTNPPTYYFDLVTPDPPQRFYRAWQTGTPSVQPSLSLDLVSALRLTGNVGDTLRVDGINQFGPIDAWFTLDRVTLTNAEQLYFDLSAPGRPARLYRVVLLP